MHALRNILAGAGLLTAAVAAGQPAAAAPAVQGYVTTSLNLRAGPGTNYPVVTTMNGGDRVTIYGCMSGWSWCDISWRGYRGWAASRYLQVTYQNHRRPIASYGRYFSLPFIQFSIGNYWGNHYRGRTFYHDMNRYGGRRSGPGPEHHSAPRKDNNWKGMAPPSGRSSFNGGQQHMHRNGPPPKGPQMSGPQTSGPQRHRPRDGDNHPHCKPGEHFVNGACR